jgi:hypothetical protein
MSTETEVKSSSERERVAGAQRAKREQALMSHVDEAIALAAELGLTETQAAFENVINSIVVEVIAGS